MPSTIGLWTHFSCISRYELSNTQVCVVGRGSCGTVQARKHSEIDGTRQLSTAATSTETSHFSPCLVPTRPPGRFLARPRCGRNVHISAWCNKFLFCLRVSLTCPSSYDLSSQATIAPHNTLPPILHLLWVLSACMVSPIWMLSPLLPRNDVSHPSHPIPLPPHTYTQEKQPSPTRTLPRRRPCLSTTPHLKACTAPAPPAASSKKRKQSTGHRQCRKA
jgi:hypothetical protein